MGRSLMPFLKGKQPDDWRDATYTQCNGVEVYASQRSVTTREFKLVYNAFDRDELYDLRNDPHELVNLEAHPDYQTIKRELYGKLWRFAWEQQDTQINPYITIALAPYGPAEAFRDAN